MEIIFFIIFSNLLPVFGGSIPSDNVDVVFSMDAEIYFRAHFSKSWSSVYTAYNL